MEKQNEYRFLTSSKLALDHEKIKKELSWNHPVATVHFTVSGKADDSSRVNRDISNFIGIVVYEPIIDKACVLAEVTAVQAIFDELTVFIDLAMAGWGDIEDARFVRKTAKRVKSMSWPDRVKGGYNARVKIW